MRQVMRDPALEKSFQKNGYVEIPFLSPQEVDEMKSKFFELLPISGGNIISSETGVAGSGEITYDFTFIDRSIEFKKAVYDVITTRFAPHVRHWLKDFRPLIANYIRKKSDTGEVPLHQNWAFVEERKYTSVSIWCPLVDSNESNGTLQVVPGSHKKFGEIRGPMVAWELDGIKNEIIQKHLVPMNIKAGTAIVLDDSIVHYSAVNKTNDLRLAIQLILAPDEVPSIHYHMNPSVSSEDVNILEVDTDFYMHFNPWKQPENPKKIGQIRNQSKPITITEFEKRLKGKRFDESDTGLMARLKSIMSAAD